MLGRPPFHDTSLISSGDLSYVGGTWQRDVAFAGYSVPLAVSTEVAAGCVVVVLGVRLQRHVPLCTVEHVAVPMWCLRGAVCERGAVE